MRAQFVFGEVWIGLRRNLTMTIALVVVVAISLSLLGTGLLFVKQADHTRAYWQSRAEISVYLCSDAPLTQQCIKNGPVTAAQEQQISHALHALPQVRSVTFISQTVACGQFKGAFASQPLLVQSTPPGEIPSSYQVRLKNAEVDAGPVTAAVTGMPGVDSVGADSILTKVYKLLDGTRNAVIVIAIILVIAAILLVANTIRLSAFNRRRETAIMRLVGASNFYVQLPFLVEGMIAGLFGWLISTGLLIAVKSLWLDGLQQYFSFIVPLSTPDLVEVIVVAMLIGLALCGATSFLTLRRYLRV